MPDARVESGQQRKRKRRCGRGPRGDEDPRKDVRAASIPGPGRKRSPVSWKGHCGIMAARPAGTIPNAFSLAILQ